MSHFVVKEYASEDAQRVADLMNASDAGWPGGLMRGSVMTAEEVIRWHEREQSLAIYLCHRGDEVVGYCSLHATPNKRDHAYVGFLNARPDVHGRGVGRRLLLRCVETATRLGFERIELGTWPANTKAVPLYKKTGFFWVPDTNVHMENYLPTILREPLVSGFFRRCDWYQHYQRQLALVEDREKWHGREVFRYRWAGGGDQIEFIIDREARGITAFEDDRLSVACVVPKNELPSGLTHSARWILVNKRRRPMEVVLLATGERGIELDARHRLTVSGRRTITERFLIRPDIEDKDWDNPAHVITTRLVVDGEPIALRSGFRVVQPVEFSFDSCGRLMPGRRQKVRLVVNNRMDAEVTGRAYLAPAADLHLSRRAIDFALPPHGRKSFDLRAQTDSTGAHLITAHARFERGGEAGEIRPRPHHLHAAPPGVATVAVRERDLTIENDCLNLHVPFKGGIHLWDVLRSRGAGELRKAMLGPPFDWRLAHESTWSHRVARESDGRATVTLSMPWESVPGLVLEQSLTLGGLPLIEIRCRVINNSDQERQPQVNLGTWGHVDHGRVTLPLKTGFVTTLNAPSEHFPEHDGEDVAQKGDDYAEHWLARESEGHVFGVIWPKPMEQDPHGGAIFQLPRLRPQESFELPPAYVYIGPGDWKTVRQWWRRLIVPAPPPEDAAPEARPYLDIGVEGRVLVTDRRTARTSVVVENRRKKVLAARLAVEPPGGWTVDPARMSSQRINVDHPLRRELRLTRKDMPPPAATEIGVRLESENLTERVGVPFVIIGDRRESVDIDEDRKSGVIWLRNGLLDIGVAPRFLGSVCSVREGEVEHLRSAFPKPGMLAYANPWYGGIHASIGWGGEAKLSKESFDHEIVTRRGSQGIAWSGVRVGCTPKHKDLRNRRMEIEYLTSPGSNVLAVVKRMANLTDANADLDLRIAHYVQPGGDFRRRTALSETERERSWRGGRFEQGSGSKRWAAVVNDDNETAVVVAAGHPRAGVSWDDIGPEYGTHLFVHQHFRLDRRAASEAFHLVVFTRGAEAAKAYRALAELKTLP